MMSTSTQLALFAMPEYVQPRFKPGMDVRAFLREVAQASRRNHEFYEFAAALGTPAVPPPSLIGEVQRALDFMQQPVETRLAQVVARFPAAEIIVKIVQERHEAVSTVALATKINAAERTAYNYAAALEAAGLITRRSQKTGWIAERLN